MTNRPDFITVDPEMLTVGDLASKRALYQLHWLLWDEMYEMGGSDKSETRAIKATIALKRPVRSECFLCEAHKNDCSVCPLHSCLRAPRGLFIEWLEASTPEARKRISALIRDVVVPYLTRRREIV